MNRLLFSKCLKNNLGENYRFLFKTWTHNYLCLLVTNTLAYCTNVCVGIINQCVCYTNVYITSINMSSLLLPSIEYLHDDIQGQRAHAWLPHQAWVRIQEKALQTSLVLHKRKKSWLNILDRLIILGTFSCVQDQACLAGFSWGLYHKAYYGRNLQFL